MKIRGGNGAGAIRVRSAAVAGIRARPQGYDLSATAQSTFKPDAKKINLDGEKTPMNRSVVRGNERWPACARLPASSTDKAKGNAKPHSWALLVESVAPIS